MQVREGGIMRQARPRDSGAAAVEFALLFPIFMILVLGTIAGGIAFSKQLTVTQAAREASRYGATYDVTVAGGIDPWLQAVRTAARQAVGNKNDPFGGYNDLCVAYVVTKTVAGVVQVDDAVGKSKYLKEDGTTDKGACPTTNPALIKDTTYVQTAIARESSFFVIFINTTLQLDAVSVTPYEARPLP